MKRPLEGVLVLEFCQFMAGPSAGLKLADMGARVIKIERPIHGEGGRQIALKNIFYDGSGIVFHTANRNKESFAADLKNPEDLAIVKKLITQADVMTHNFRPGVMEKIGLDYETAKALNPKLIYATVTGYGTKGPWVGKPGQDLLAQSVSGLNYLTGDRDDDPTPMALAIADMYCGTHLAQGILAALIKRGKTGLGSLIEVSLLESSLDLQFEVLTTWLNSGRPKPERAEKGSAHAYLKAPYGVYQTANGYLAMGHCDIEKLAVLLNNEKLKTFKTMEQHFLQRDQIMNILREQFITKNTEHWLSILESAGVWCSQVMDFKQLTSHNAFETIQFMQDIKMKDGSTFTTVRCPIRFNDERLFSEKGAPRVGEDNNKIKQEFNL